MYSDVGNKSLAMNDCLMSLTREALIIYSDDDVRFSDIFLTEYAKIISSSSCMDKVYYGGPFGVDYEKQPSPIYSDFLPPSAKGAENDFFLKDNVSWFPDINWGCQELQSMKIDILKSYTKVVLNLCWGVLIKDKIRITIGDLFMTTFNLGKLKSLLNDSRHQSKARSRDANT